MSFVLYFISLSLLAVFSISNAQIKDYYIMSTNQKCALLSLNADLFVRYDTKYGENSSKISFQNSKNEQEGQCSNTLGEKSAIFNILLNEDQKLIFNFENINNLVILSNITFIYKLPNAKFPNATMNGTFTATSSINQKLSSSSQYYHCTSPNNITLSKDVTFRVSEIKVKVFNVENSAFGIDKSECQYDIHKDVFSTTNDVSTVTSDSMSSTTAHSVASTTTPNIASSSSTLDSTPVQSVSTSTHTMSDTTSSSPIISSSTSKSATTPMISSSSSKSATTPMISSSTSKSATTPSTSPAHTSTVTPSTTTVSPNGPKFAIRGKDSVCLLLQGEMLLVISYEAQKLEKKWFKITQDYDYNGYCLKNDENITLSNSGDIFVTFIFHQANEIVSLQSLEVTVFLRSKFFPDAKTPNSKLYIKTEFGSTYEIGANRGYYCNKNMTMGGNTIYLYAENLKFEAFRKDNNTDFGNNMSTCGNDPTVAIIVGIVLAVFLIVVICLFVIFQIRAKRRQGYREI